MLWGLFAMADVQVTARLRSLTPGVEIASWRRELAGSGVCREVTRQGGRPAYRAHDADSQAWEARRSKALLTV